MAMSVRLVGTYSSSCELNITDESRLWWELTRTEYARANVTASGSPSGTATTRTVTPMMKYLTNCWRYSTFQGFFSIANVSIEKRRMRIKTVSTATIVPVNRAIKSSKNRLKCQAHQPSNDHTLNQMTTKRSGSNNVTLISIVFRCLLLL